MRQQKNWKMKMSEKIVATYTNPQYRFERVMCGINSFRNASYPDGFKKETIRL